jgi:NADH dehydrogenase (ubiquinone) 1 alpha subcomplex subunit 10
MACLASKLVSLVPGSGASAAGQARLLAVQVLNNKVPCANIYSKTSGQMEERLKPWDYKKWGYGYMLQVTEGTTKRFNDNTKVIVVEGPPGLEKSKFAKEFAEEFGMLYVPGASMDDWYINSYGYDLRELDWQFHHQKNKCYDEKNFAKDPLGGEGGLDRMVTTLQKIRAFKYNDLLAHVFNTGQGIVTEKSPYSEAVFIEAAYRMGWIHKSTRIYYYRIQQQILQHLLRPNVIIHLDAPTDVVQAKIRARSKTTHPWEKDSPVFENSTYLNMLYQDMLKNDYMKKASVFSKILTYDWSEGGDTEVVVEDVERLQLEYFDKYDKQQSDWRMHKEENYSMYRRMYTERQWISSAVYNRAYLDADYVEKDDHEEEEWCVVAQKLPGNRFNVGWNKDLGESGSWVQIGQPQTANPYYDLPTEALHSQELEEYFEERERKRLAGEANWWNF